MSELLGVVAEVGRGVRAAFVPLTLATGVILVGALVADRLLGRRVSAGVRVWLYGAVLARVFLPGDWSTPLGLMGSRAPAPAPLVELGETPVVVGATAAAAGAPDWPGLLAGGVYLLGGLALLLRWSLARRALVRALRQALPAPLGAAAPVAMHDTLGPLVAGIFAPRIVLPRPVVAAHPAVLACVLAHEGAHVARRDHLTAPLVQLACILAWPILPVWIAARRMRALVELACDERALAGRTPAERRQYGEVLLALATGEGPAVAAGVPSFGSDLAARLRALRVGRRWPLALQACAAATLGLALLACSGTPPAAEAPAADARPTRSKDPVPILTVTRSGALFLGWHEVPPEALEREVRAALAASGGPTLFLRMDGGNREPTRELASTLRRAGAHIVPFGAGSPGPGLISASPSVEGSLHPEIVGRIVRRHVNEVKFCYQQELSTRPTLRGRVVVGFTIGAKGTVTHSAIKESNVGAPDLERCLTIAVRRWEFPKPPGGDPVEVAFPFVFTPNAAARQADSEREAVEEESYEVSVNRDMRARVAGVQRCYDREAPSHRNPKRRMRVHLALTIAADGSVAAADLKEAQDATAAIRACVLTTVKGWRFPQPPSAPYAFETEFPVVLFAGP